MIVIPQNLPSQVAPLTWLLGTWVGWGTQSSPDGSNLVTFEFDCRVVGEQVSTRLAVFNTDAVVEVDAQVGALEGIDLLPRSGVASEETAYWKVLKDTDGEDNYLQVTSASTDGIAGLWVGRVQGPRIRLLIDTAVHKEGAPAASLGERMLGLVNSDIFFNETLNTDKGDFVVSGRVARVEEAKPIETFEKE